MSVDLAAFKLSFPECVPAGDPLIGAKLAEAQAQVDYSIYSTAHGDIAVKYLTAHLLATSPAGKAARLVSKDGRTTYLDQYETMVRSAAAGGRVP